MSDPPRRKPLRLPEYDYSTAGMYFVTICTHGRELLFGRVHAETVALSSYGLIVQECWDSIPQHYPGVRTDAFVIMPNHVHGLVQLTETAGHTRTLGRVIGSFKSAVSGRVNSIRATPGAPVWQRGYFERVLRNENELLRARRYIVDNPLKWHLDQENPRRTNAGGLLG